MKATALIGCGAVIALLTAQHSPPAFDGVPEYHDGLIEAHRVVRLSPAVDGVLKEVLVDRGDFVEANQVVAELESSVERASLAVAKARTELAGEMKSREISLIFSERRLRQNQKLHLQGILSEFQADETEAEQEIAAASLLQAQERMYLAEKEYATAKAAVGRRTIRTPVSGVVVEKLLLPGELATRQSQSVIVEIAEIHPLNVEIILPVSMFGTIELGDEADVFPQAPIAGEYRARVSVVDRVVNAESGTFRVRLQLPNPDFKLPAGIRCKARFLP